MDVIYFYIVLGFQHVVDLNGLDHLYFIVALSLPYGFRKWRRLLWWVTLFTLGHSLSLIGNYYLNISFSSYWIELLIPITIAISCLPLLQQAQPKKVGFASGLTFVFGLIHGLGFGRFFGMMVDPEAAVTSLFSFALGVEIAQLGIVLGVVITNFVFKNKPQILALWQRCLGFLIFLLALVMIVERI